MQIPPLLFVNLPHVLWYVGHPLLKFMYLFIYLYPPKLKEEEKTIHANKYVHVFVFMGKKKKT